MSQWWKQYPVRGSRSPYPPDGVPDPRFVVGASVRLRGKPELIRRVLAVEWHSIRREFSYIVETTAPLPFQPYWFAEQLLVVISNPTPEQPIENGKISFM